MIWFRRNKKESRSEGNPFKQPIRSKLKPIEYHPKIVIAWAKAIDGNTTFLKWLKDNGYPELVYASSAIYLKNEARDWLMENGYAHLMAMINAAEGNEKAQDWLKKHRFDLLYHIAMAVEHENRSWVWLKKNSTPDIFILAQTITKVKDKIEENHNDIHRFGDD
jgi:NADH:ubiquinone oxidoreductase subunit C